MTVDLANSRRKLRRPAFMNPAGGGAETQMGS